MELVKAREYYKNKILPVSEPMITTYTQHAHLLSILTYYSMAHPWIYSNYIQLYINEDYIHNWGDFYFPFPYELRAPETCKWIDFQKMNRSIVADKWETIIDFIIECIDSNNYIHTMINYFYIPVSDRYNQSNLNHDILIYGYDGDTKELYVSDFFQNGKYSNQKISFHDFSQAFSNYYLATNSDYLQKMIYLYRFNETCDYKFSIKNITNSFKVYLNSDVPEYWDIYNNENKANIVFGRNVYTTLKNYAARIKLEEEDHFDLRPFYMMYDHKKIMCLRLKYLMETGYFKSLDYDEILLKANEIESDARNLVNLTIKYNYSKNIAVIDNINNMLEDIEKNEFHNLKQFIN